MKFSTLIAILLQQAFAQTMPATLAPSTIPDANTASVSTPNTTSRRRRRRHQGLQKPLPLNSGDSAGTEKRRRQRAAKSSSSRSRARLAQSLSSRRLTEEGQCVELIISNLKFTGDRINLHVMDDPSWGTVDVYCKLRVGTESHTTKTLHDDNRPNWHNTTWRFNIEDASASNLTIACYDSDGWDSVTGSDDYIGEYQSPVSSLRPHERTYIHNGTEEVYLELDTECIQACPSSSSDTQHICLDGEPSTLCDNDHVGIMKCRRNSPFMCTETDMYGNYECKQKASECGSLLRACPQAQSSSPSTTTTESQTLQTTAARTITTTTTAITTTTTTTTTTATKHTAKATATTCTHDANCTDVASSRCARSSGRCRPCVRQWNCDHFRDTSKCASGTCVSCDVFHTKSYCFDYQCAWDDELGSCSSCKALSTESKCASNGCTWDPFYEKCVVCMTDDDCRHRAIPKCSKDKTACIQCAHANDCLHFEGSKCYSGMCVACVGNDDCPDRTAPRCSYDHTACTHCYRDNDCAHLDSMKKCFFGKCYECAGDEYCTDAKKKMCLFGFCRACVVNDDCADRAASKCSDDGTACIQCVRDDDCAHLDSAQKCNSGTCVAMLTTTTTTTTARATTTTTTTVTTATSITTTAVATIAAITSTIATETTFQTNHCVCKNGVPVENAFCSKHGANECAICAGNYHLDRKNIKHCKANECVCENGTPVVNALCTKHGANECSSCAKNYNLGGENGRQCEGSQRNVIVVACSVSAALLAGVLMSGFLFSRSYVRGVAFRRGSNTEEEESAKDITSTLPDLEKPDDEEKSLDYACAAATAMQKLDRGEERAVDTHWYYLDRARHCQVGPLSMKEMRLCFAKEFLLWENLEVRKSDGAPNRFARISDWYPACTPPIEPFTREPQRMPATFTAVDDFVQDDSKRHLLLNAPDRGCGHDQPLKQCQSAFVPSESVHDATTWFYHDATNTRHIGPLTRAQLNNWFQWGIITSLTTVQQGRSGKCMALHEVLGRTQSFSGSALTIWRDNASCIDSARQTEGWICGELSLPFCHSPRRRHSWDQIFQTSRSHVGSRKGITDMTEISDSRVHLLQTHRRSNGGSREQTLMPLLMSETTPGGRAMTPRNSGASGNGEKMLNPLTCPVSHDEAHSDWVVHGTESKLGNLEAQRPQLNSTGESAKTNDWFYLDAFQRHEIGPLTTEQMRLLFDKILCECDELLVRQNNGAPNAFARVQDWYPPSISSAKPFTQEPLGSPMTFTIVDSMVSDNRLFNRQVAEPCMLTKAATLSMTDCGTALIDPCTEPNADASVNGRRSELRSTVAAKPELSSTEESAKTNNWFFVDAFRLYEIGPLSREKMRHLFYNVFNEWENLLVRRDSGAPNAFAPVREWYPRSTSSVKPFTQEPLCDPEAFTHVIGITRRGTPVKGPNVDARVLAKVAMVGDEVTTLDSTIETICVVSSDTLKSDTFVHSMESRIHKGDCVKWELGSTGESAKTNDWFYLDAHMREVGPFTFDQMLSWFQWGQITMNTSVRQRGKTCYSAFSDVIQHTSAKLNPATNAGRDSEKYGPRADDGGPSETTGTGFKTASRSSAIRVNLEEEKSEAMPEDDDVLEAALSGNTVHSDKTHEWKNQEVSGNPEEWPWRYIDSDGETHGPFTTAEMRTKLQDGLFGKGQALEDMLVKNGAMESWAPLGYIYVNVKEAFTWVPTRIKFYARLQRALCRAACGEAKNLKASASFSGSVTPTTRSDCHRTRKQQRKDMLAQCKQRFHIDVDAQREPRRKRCFYAEKIPRASSAGATTRRDYTRQGNVSSTRGRTCTYPRAAQNESCHVKAGQNDTRRAEMPRNEVWRPRVARNDLRAAGGTENDLRIPTTRLVLGALRRLGSVYGLDNVAQSNVATPRSDDGRNISAVEKRQHHGDKDRGVLMRDFPVRQKNTRALRDVSANDKARLLPVGVLTSPHHLQDSSLPARPANHELQKDWMSGKRLPEYMSGMSSRERNASGVSLTRSRSRAHRRAVNAHGLTPTVTVSPLKAPRTHA